MKLLPLALVALVCLAVPCAVCRAQQAAGNDDSVGETVNVNVNPARPPTQLETMLRQAGVLILKSFTEVADVSGDNGFGLRVTAMELTDRAADARRYGLAIEVHGTDRGWPRATSFVDDDEIDALTAALDAIRATNRNDVHLRELATQYRTRGNLEVAGFDLSGAATLAVRAVQNDVATGRTTWATVRFPAARLPEIRQQLVNAKQQLDAARQQGGHADARRK
jgi:hypothetical protein